MQEFLSVRFCPPHFIPRHFSDRLWVYYCGPRFQTNSLSGPRCPKRWTALG